MLQQSREDSKLEWIIFDDGNLFSLVLLIWTVDLAVKRMEKQNQKVQCMMNESQKLKHRNKCTYLS